jgi:phospholipase C
VGAIVAALAVSGGAIAASTAAAGGAHGHGAAGRHARTAETASTTPVKHVVVIFGENVSFDHYFGTYPQATNSDGQPFKAAKNTPAVDGLTPATAESLPPALRHKEDLRFSNPNSASPQRLDSSATGLQSSAGGQLTCDQDHNYSDEQQAFDGGKMDHFVQSVGTGTGTGPSGAACNPAQVMDYYDGNTVTGLWNYAQHFAMSDNSYGTTFGPSAPGAINLVAGDTGEVDTSHMVNSPSISTPTSPNADLTANGLGGYSLTSDAQPYWDDCSTRDAVAMNGTNIGEELNEKGLSWGWFEGGFRPSATYQEATAAVGKAGQTTGTFEPDEFKTFYSNAEHRPAHSSNQANCDAVHPVGVALGGTGQWGYKDDYIPHHEPFQFYAATANPHHLTIPTNGSGQDTLAGLESIGHDTQSYVEGKPQFNTPNHNYDTSDFNQLVEAINNGEMPSSALPNVSFLKAPGYEDGHAAYSDPADEQAFVTSVINELERSPDWKSTAVFVSYDDSDGWYDHAYSGVTNPSLSPADNLTNTSFTVSSTGTSGQCGPSPQTTAPLAGEQGRCGFGPRLPLLLISPFAKKNAVDHNLSNQASMINFVEYNWGLPGIPGSVDQAEAATDASEGVPFDLAGLFQLSGKKAGKLFLNPATGQKQP